MSTRIYYESVETKIVKKKGYVDIDPSYTQVYNCLFKIAFKMKSIVETQLLFYFCTKASDDGMFFTDEKSYIDFVKHSNEHGGGDISRVTFTNAVKNLSENKVLIKVARGRYQLNPFLLWKQSQHEKKEHLKELMLTENKELKNKYLLPKNIID